MFFSGKRYFHTTKIVKEAQPEIVKEEKEDKSKNTDELEELLGKDFDMKKLKKLFGKDFILILLKLLLGLRDKDKGRKGGGRKMRKAPSSSFATAGQVKKERADRLKKEEKGKISLSVTKILGEKQREGESDGDYRSRRLGELIKLVASAGDNFDGNLAVLSAAALDTKSDGTLPGNTPADLKRVLGNMFAFREVLETGQYEDRNISAAEKRAIERAVLNSLLDGTDATIQGQYLSKKKGVTKQGVDEARAFLEELFGADIAASIDEQLGGAPPVSRKPGDPKAKFKPGTGRTPSSDKPPKGKGGSFKSPKKPRKPKKPDDDDEPGPEAGGGGILSGLGVSVPGSPEDQAKAEAAAQTLADAKAEALVLDLEDGVDDNLEDAGTWLPTNTKKAQAKASSDTNYADYVSSDGVDEEVDHTRKDKTFSVTDRSGSRPQVKVTKLPAGTGQVEDLEGSVESVEVDVEQEEAEKLAGRPATPAQQAQVEESERKAAEKLFKQRAEKQVLEGSVETEPGEPEDLGGSVETPEPGEVLFKKVYTKGKKQTTIDDVFIPATEDLDYTTEEQQTIQDLLENYASGGDKGKLLLKLKTMVKRKKETGSILTKERTKSAKTRIDSKSEIQYTFPEGVDSGSKKDRVFGIYTNKDGSERFSMFDDIPQAANLQAMISDEKDKKKQKELMKILEDMETDYVNMKQREAKDQDEEAREGYDDLYTEDALDDLGEIDDKRKLFLKDKIILNDAIFDDQNPEALGDDEEIVGIGSKGVLISGGPVFRYLPHKLVTGKAKQALDEEHSLLVKAEQEKLDTSVETAAGLDTSVETAPEEKFADFVSSDTESEPAQEPSVDTSKPKGIDIDEEIQAQQFQELKEQQQAEADYVSQQLQAEEDEKARELEEAKKLSLQPSGGAAKIVYQTAPGEQVETSVEVETEEPKTNPPPLGGKKVGGKPSVKETFAETDSQVKGVDDELARLEQQLLEAPDDSLEIDIQEIDEPSPKKPQELDESVDLDEEVEPLGKGETKKVIRTRIGKIKKAKGAEISVPKSEFIIGLLNSPVVKRLYDDADDEGKDKLVADLVDRVAPQKRLTKKIKDGIDNDFTSGDVFTTENKSQSDRVKQIRKERREQLEYVKQQGLPVTQADIDTSTEASGSQKVKTPPESEVGTLASIDETATETETQFTEGGSKKPKQRKTKRKTRVEREDELINKPNKSLGEQLKVDGILAQRQKTAIQKTQERIAQAAKTAEELEAEVLEAGLGSKQKRVERYVDDSLKQLKSQRKTREERSDSDTATTISSGEAERRQQDLFFDILDYQREPKQVKRQKGESKRDYKERIRLELQAQEAAEPPKSKLELAKEKAQEKVTGLESKQASYLKGLYSKLLKEEKEAQGGDFDQKDFDEQFLDSIDEERLRAKQAAPELVTETPGLTKDTGAVDIPLGPDADVEPLTPEQKFFITGNPTYKQVGVSKEQVKRLDKIYIEPADKDRRDYVVSATDTRAELFKKIERIQSKITSKSSQLEIQQAQTAIEQLIREKELAQEGQQEALKERLLREETELREKGQTIGKKQEFLTETQLQAKLRPREELGTPAMEADEIYKRALRTGRSEQEASKLRSDYIELQDARFGFRGSQAEAQARLRGQDPAESRRYGSIPLPGESDKSDIERQSLLQQAREFERIRLEKGKKNPYTQKKKVFVSKGKVGGFEEQEVDLLEIAEAQKSFKEYSDFLDEKGIDLIEERRAIRQSLFGLPRDDPKRAEAKVKQDERETELLGRYKLEKAAYEEQQKRTLGKIEDISRRQVTKVKTPPKSDEDITRDRLQSIQPGYVLREQKIVKELGEGPAAKQKKQEFQTFKIGGKSKVVEEEEAQLYESELTKVITEERTRLKGKGIADVDIQRFTGLTPDEARQKREVEKEQAKQLRLAQKEAKKVKDAEERAKKAEAKKAQPKKSKEELQKEYEQLTGSFTEELEYDYTLEGDETPEQKAKLLKLQAEQERTQTELQKLLEKVRPKTPAGSVVSAATSSEELASEGSSGVGGGNLYADLSLPERLELFQASQADAGIADSDVSSSDLQQFNLSRQDFKPQVPQEDDSFSTKTDESD